MRQFFILFLFLISAFSFQNIEGNKSTIALQKVKTQLQTGLTLFQNEVNTLQTTAQKLEASTASIEQLQKAIINTRLTYKKVEFLLAYFDASNIKKNINGAPLPTVEPSAPSVMVIEPSGLQVLDELIFSDEVFEKKADIIFLVKKLRKDLEQLIQFQSNLKITHRPIFEAMRQQLIRVFTLGVTGFDTPGSANAIPEVRAALDGMYEALKAYMPLIEEKSIGLAIVMDARMEHTLQYLESDDFDTFDRMQFLKEHIEPQYDIIYNIQKDLGIEFIEETTDQIQAVNYHSKSIFANDFLNAGYYANLDMKHPLMEKRIDLGKILFFDPILSSNIERSCASCHQPEKAFTDGKTKSTALNFEGTLNRNSPTLVNAVYADKYFWDIREKRLDKQMLHVIKSHQEFDTDYIKIIQKLNQSTAYKELFQNAYPAHPNYAVSTYTISDALSAYVASLRDFDSPFDKYIKGEIPKLDPTVYRGFNLFMGKAACGTCHFAPVFNGTVPPHYEESESEVLGIPVSKDSLNVLLDEDLGRYANKIQKDRVEFYKHSFKTVSVRNVALTAPYMHNGVYDTLEEVVDFYNKGGGAGMGMDLAHQTLPFSELNLTNQEKSDLVAFMKSLTGDMSKFTIPDTLPSFDTTTEWNNRKVGGEY